mgnify:CR=1 FL=1
MKKVSLIILILLVTTITGCRYFLPDRPKVPYGPDKTLEDPQPKAEEEVSQQEAKSEQRISEDGVLHFIKGNITLLAYEDEMNLMEILGTPLEDETIVLENADTFTGSQQKTLTYQDTRLVLFSPPQDGQRFYLINIVSENEEAVTNRGIAISDTLEELQKAYPEMTRSLDGTTGIDGRYEMMFQEFPYTYLYFFVEEGKVNKIELLHEFP